MRFASILLTLAASAVAWQPLSALSGLSSSGNITNRPDLSHPPSQNLLDNYLLALAQAQSALYQLGLQKFSQQEFVSNGFPDPFYSYLKQIAQDEIQHSQKLVGFLKSRGATPIQPCQYAFGVITSVQEFVSVASIIEGVAVSAYAGAIPQVLGADRQTVLAQIEGNKARHAAYFLLIQGQSPFPQAYDVPLSLDLTWTLASPFIISCPAYLELADFPGLNAVKTQKVPVTAGDTFTVVSDNTQLPSKGLKAAWLGVDGPIFNDAVLGPNSTVVLTVPRGVLGRVYVVLTPREQLNDFDVLAGPDIVPVV